MSNLNILWLRKVVDSYLFPITLLLISFSFPFNKTISNVLIIFLFLLWLIKCNIKDRMLELKSNKLALLFLTSYFVYIICLIYSEDHKSGLFILEKKLSLILFPIILSTEKLKRGLVNKILLSFVISCFLATLLSILHIYYLHFYTEIPLPSLTVESFYRDNFTSLLDIHPTYYSLYIAFSAIVIVFFLFRDWNKLKIYVKFLALFVIVYFACINILLSSRMLLLISLLILVTLLIRLLFKNRVAGIIIILFLTLSTTFYFIHKNNIIKKRFTELTETQWTPPIGIYYNSTNLRVGILNCSFSLLKNNWLFGFGTGSAQKNLNACYQSSGYSDVLFIDQYDTHNQYLNVWLNTGLIGLAIFLLTIVIPMKKAYKANCFLYLAFLSLIALCCFTESLLERQNGIVFYAFFNSLFAFHFFENSKNED